MYSLIFTTCLACSKPLKTIDNLDKTRYLGTWYEIARLPNWFEKKCKSDITANYSVKQNGLIEVKNSCKNSKGKIEQSIGEAKFVTLDTKGELKVSFAGVFDFLPFTWGDYNIIYLEENYQYALVGSKSRDYLWILSRTKKLDEKTIEKLKQKAIDSGFDSSKLILVENE